MVAILVAFINDMGVCWRNTRPLAAFPRAATAVAAADSAGLHYHVVQRPSMGSLKIAKNWKTVFLLRVFIRVPWTREPHNLEMPKTQNRQCSDEKSKKHPRD